MSRLQVLTSLLILGTTDDNNHIKLTCHLMQHRVSTQSGSSKRDQAT